MIEDMGRALDRIALTGLRGRGYHGVHGVERVQGQDFVVDVALDLDLRVAIGSDDVADTVDYGELAGRLVAIVGGPPVNLIETLAARLADACLADGRVVSVTVTVHKPHAPIPHEFADVSVTLRRRPAGPAPRAAHPLADHDPRVMIGGISAPKHHDHDECGGEASA